MLIASPIPAPAANSAAATAKRAPASPTVSPSASVADRAGPNASAPATASPGQRTAPSGRLSAPVISVCPVRASYVQWSSTSQKSAPVGAGSGPLGPPGSSTAAGFHATVASASVGIASPTDTTVGLSHRARSRTR